MTVNLLFVVGGVKQLIYVVLCQQLRKVHKHYFYLKVLLYKLQDRNFLFMNSTTNRESLNSDDGTVLINLCN